MYFFYVVRFKNKFLYSRWKNDFNYMWFKKKIDLVGAGLTNFK